MPSIMQTSEEKGSCYSFHPRVCGGTGSSESLTPPQPGSHLHTTLAQAVLWAGSVESECRVSGELYPQHHLRAPQHPRAVLEGGTLTPQLSIQSRAIKIGTSV